MHGYGWGMEKVDGSSLLNLEKGFLHLQFIFCLQTWKSEWKYKINMCFTALLLCEFALITHNAPCSVKSSIESI